MSVDNDAMKGIGYEVFPTSEVLDNIEGVIEFHHWLDEQISADFESFIVGNDLTGRVDGTFITAKYPLKYGLDLTQIKKDLDDEIERLGLSAGLNFGVVGGLWIS